MAGSPTPQPAGPRGSRRRRRSGRAVLKQVKEQLREILTLFEE
jgi:hypothetical protein